MLKAVKGARGAYLWVTAKLTHSVSVACTYDCARVLEMKAWAWPLSIKIVIASKKVDDSHASPPAVNM